MMRYPLATFWVVTLIFHVASAQNVVRPVDAVFVFSTLANTNRFNGFVDYARRFQDCTNPALFRVSPERVPIDEAEEFCAAVGFDLLTIESESVQASAEDYMERLIAQGTVEPSATFWMNMAQNDNAARPDRGWRLRDGRDLTYFNWGVSEPNDIAVLINGSLAPSSENGAEQCAVVDAGNGFTWADEQCLNRDAFAICQDSTARARIENCAPFSVYGQGLSMFMENAGQANGIAQAFITLARQQELRPLTATYEAIIGDLNGREDLLTDVLFIVTDVGDQDVEERLVGSTAAGAFANAVVRATGEQNAVDALTTVFGSIFDRGGVIAATLMDSVFRRGAATRGAARTVVADAIGRAIAASIEEDALAIIGSLMQPADLPQGGAGFVSSVYTSAITNGVDADLLGRMAVEAVLDGGSGNAERQNAAGLAFLRGIQGAVNVTESRPRLQVDPTAPFAAALAQAPGAMFTTLIAGTRARLGDTVVRVLVDAAGGPGNVDCDEDASFVVPALREVFQAVPEQIPARRAQELLTLLEASDLAACLDDVPQTSNVQADSAGK